MARDKAAIHLDLPRPPGLADGSAQSRQDCISDALREAILNKLLPSGSRLPSTRTLASRWGVARGTVESSFERLCSEGYICRAQGSGTRVSAVIPDNYLSASKGAPRPAARQRGTSAEGATVSPYVPHNSVESGVPFIARQADPGLLRMEKWKRHVAAGLLRMGAADLGSPPLQGVRDLRARIAEYLGKYRGIGCTADDVVITTGIRHSIDLVARTVLGPGRTVLVEDPGYRSALQLFKMAGATTIDVPVDREGIDTSVLARYPDASAAYVTPAHQSPLGVAMSLSRRLELLDWARGNAAWIIEDDYDGEFGYQTAPLPALKSLDMHDRVIYCGSFNKTLFSGLRVGFMVVPAALRASLFKIWHTTGRAVGVTEQFALAHLIESEEFARHLRASRHAYLMRRNAVCEQLQRHAQGRYTISGEHAGFHFILWLEADRDEAAFVAQAAQHGLRLQPLHAFCRSVRLPPGIVIGYAALTLAQTRHAGKLLAQLLARPDGASPRRCPPSDRTR